MKRRPGLGASAFAVATVLAGVLAANAAFAQPAEATPTHHERFTAVIGLRVDSEQPVWSAVTATGAFTDIGTVRFGADDPDGTHHDILILSRGTIDLAEGSTTDSFRFNPRTCTGSDHEAGTYTLTGSGHYAGMSGTGTWHHNATIIAPFGPDCSPDNPQTVCLVVFRATTTRLQLSS
jgi:hypothetical protein